MKFQLILCIAALLVASAAAKAIEGKLERNYFVIFTSVSLLIDSSININQEFSYGLSKVVRFSGRRRKA